MISRAGNEPGLIPKLSSSPASHGPHQQEGQDRVHGDGRPEQPPDPGILDPQENQIEGDQKAIYEHGTSNLHLPRARPAGDAECGQARAGDASKWNRDTGELGAKQQPHDQFRKCQQGEAGSGLASRRKCEENVQGATFVDCGPCAGNAA